MEDVKKCKLLKEVKKLVKEERKEMKDDVIDLNKKYESEKLNYEEFLNEKIMRKKKDN